MVIYEAKNLGNTVFYLPREWTLNIFQHQLSSSSLCFEARRKKKFCASASGANNVCKVGPLFPEQRTAHAARPTSLCDKAKKVWGIQQGLRR